MNIIQWMKNNLVLVISVLVAALSLGVIGWAQMQGSSLQDEVAKKQQTLQQIRNMRNQTVDVPGPTLEQARITVNGVTINDAAINQLREIYNRIQSEYSDLSTHVLRVNRQGKRPLVEGLFPNQPSTPALLYEARSAYRQALQNMLRPYEQAAEGPRLDAGAPPSAARIKSELDKVTQSFQSMQAGMQQRNRNPEEVRAEQQQLVDQQRTRLVEVLRDRASQIHLYAATDVRDPAFPFEVGAWSEPSPTSQPTMEQLWEGQLELWIQQDVAAAIARANQTSNPDVSVIDAPVKRLISVRVWPGYVGLHNAGALVSSSGSRAIPPKTLPYSAPVGGRTGEASELQPVNFAVGPTGRVSNGLYDVRHVVVELVADIAQMPRLFEAINRTNLMTVLQVTMEQVDEYQALSEGYFYGSSDVVRARLVVESVWLRTWTEPLMPTIVRQYVGIDEPTLIQQGNQPVGPEEYPGYEDPYGGYGYPGYPPY